MRLFVEMWINEIRDFARESMDLYDVRTVDLTQIRSATSLESATDGRGRISAGTFLAWSNYWRPACGIHGFSVIWQSGSAFFSACSPVGVISTFVIWRVLSEVIFDRVGTAASVTLGDVLT